MPTCSEFRARARKNLGGNIFANAWLFTLLAILINGAILSFTSISIIGAILLYGPMTYGLAKFMLLITRSEGKKTDLATLFNGFTDDFGGTLCLRLHLPVVVAVLHPRHYQEVFVCYGSVHQGRSSRILGNRVHYRKPQNDERS